MTIDTTAGALKGSEFSISSANRATDAILKEFYIPAVRDLLNNKTILLRYIRKNTEDIQGKYAVVPLNVARNEGIGHIGEGGALPDPGTQSYERAKYNLKYFYGRIKFSGPSDNATRGSRGSFLRMMDSEVTGVARDMVRELNRVAFGDGSGRLARIAANPTTTTPTLDRPLGFASTDFGAKHMRAPISSGAPYADNAMRLAILDASAGDAVLSVKTVTAVNYDTNVVTLNTSEASAAIGDWLVRASNTTTTDHIDTGYLNEPFGLHALTGDANPYGGVANYVGQIDRTALDAWNGLVLENGGTPIPFNQDIFQQLMDGIDKRGDGVVNAFVTTHGIRRAYQNQLEANKRFIRTMKLEGGYETLEYSGRPVVPDRDCTRGFIYALDWSCLHWFMGEDFSFMDKDNSYLSRIDNQDAYQATLYRYHQLGTDAPNRLGRAVDIIDD